MFLIRSAFWLTLVLLILPVNWEEAGIAEGPGTFETLAAVQTVFADVRGFCDRNAQACLTGAATVDVLRQKAVYSAGLVQGWLASPQDERVMLAQGRLPAGDHGEQANDELAALIRATGNPAPSTVTSAGQPAL
jgi:hypothetical protein